jgi:hypothetical protein
MTPPGAEGCVACYDSSKDIEQGGGDKVSDLDAWDTDIKHHHAFIARLTAELAEVRGALESMVLAELEFSYGELSVEDKAVYAKARAALRSKSSEAK